MKSHFATAHHLSRPIRWHVLAAASLLAVVAAPATDLTFQFAGTNVTLTEVTADVGVRFQAMRFNPASSQWNLDVSLTNKSYRTMPGPLVVLVESFSGTTGPLQPDSWVGDNPAKAWFDLTPQAGAGQLWPGETTDKRLVLLGYNGGAPTLHTRVFANLAAAEPGLALVRTLDALGQPLPDVEILETGPTGSVSRRSDPDFAQATLGGSDGPHTWQFSAPGHLSVWRRDTLQRGVVSVVFNPRLTPLTSPVTLPLAGGEVTNADGSVRLQFAAGTFTQGAAVSLTPLSAQTLPAMLPPGWSPMQAIHLELSAAPATPVAAQLRLWDTLGTSETVALARWNAAAFQWDVLQTLVRGAAETVAATLPVAGSYALLAPDTELTAPPLAQVGLPLPASSAAFPDASTLTAGGGVNPAISLASRVAERVTATAQLAITNSGGALPSGLPLRCEVREQYELRDGTRRQSPAYENFLIGYQRPGDAEAATLHSAFPMRPRLLFGTETLAAATVSAEVLTPTPFGGRVLDARGGQAPVQGLTLLAAPGDFAERQAIILRRLDPTNFAAAAGLPVVAAFDLSLSGVTAGRHLALQIEGAPSNSLLVLTKVLSSADRFGLQPIERLQSDAAGRLTSLEPASGERLPGLNCSGQFLVVTVTNAHGLVTGIARNSSGQSAAGLPVRLTCQPWLTYSASNGAYRLIAATGTSTVDVTDPTTGDHGQAGVNLPDAGAVVSANPSATPAGPRVVSINPTNGATRVPRVSPIAINFSEPINPGSLGGGGAQLFNATGGIVTASVSLNLQNTVLTLLPVAQLAANTAHTMVLSLNLADPTGLKLEGPRQFSFTTESDALDRVGAQVVSYEPVNGQATMTGSPGTAEPESPVILVNETTGQTATILSKPDGSFSNSIPADVDDQLSAVLVNRNGTRNTIPVSYQIYRDGSVGVFNQGGVLRAQGEGRTVEVTIDPGAIPNRGRFKAEVVSAARVEQLISNTPPQGARLVGPGLRLTAVGDYLKGGMDIAFPVGRAELEVLGLPPGGDPTNGCYALAVLTRVGEDIAYLLVDKMVYEDGRLVTHSEPFPGTDWLLREPLRRPTPEELTNLKHQLETGQDLESASMLANTGTTLTYLSGGDPTSFGNVFIGGYVRVLLLPLALSLTQGPTVFNGTVIEAAVRNGVRTGASSPLAGAMVTAKATPTAGQFNTRPGRLDPGVVYAISRADGRYALTLPRTLELNDVFLLSASHPKYLGWRNTDLVFPNIPRVINHDLVFPYPADALPDPRPPAVSISHEPHRPFPGENAVLRVVSTHGSAVPTVTLQASRVQRADNTAGTLDDVHFALLETEAIGTQGSRTTFIIRCRVEARVEFTVNAHAEGAMPANVKYSVEFGGSDPAPIPVAASDPHDHTGPRVVASIPAANTRAWPLGQSVRLVFSEALDPATATDPSLIQLQPSAGIPSVEIGSDLRTMDLTYPGLLADTDYTLTILPGMRDVSDWHNLFDQDPKTPGQESFTLAFRTAPAFGGELPGIQFGGGAVIRGIYAYVLERTGPLDGALAVFDLSLPSEPARVAQLDLPGYPRDLAMIPAYSFKLRTNGPVETKDLLAVVGGKVGGTVDSLGNSFGGQYLWIVDISDPLNPQRLSGAMATFSPSAVINKVSWSPPYLSYLQLDNDVVRVDLVNLQTMLVGLNLGPGEFFDLDDGRPGSDLNGDGDYVDAGETLPLPARARDSLAGLIRSFTSDEPALRINDYSWDSRAQTLGAILEPVGTSGQTPGIYSTLYSKGLLLSLTNASWGAPGHQLKRVFLLPNASIEGPGGVRVADLALVSATSISNEPLSQVFVLDITDPTDPVALSSILVPQEQGSVWSIQRRDDGMLVLATSRDGLLLNPVRLAQAPTAGGLHPSIVGRIPGIGAGTRTFAGTVAGLNAVSAGGIDRIVQTAPRISFVSFPSMPPFVPAGLVARHAELDQLFSGLVMESSLRPARHRTITNVVASTLLPPQAQGHYYVMVDAPGSAGETIELTLESLNFAGRPQPDKGLGFPPVRAMSAETQAELGSRLDPACRAPIRSLTAYRLSNQKGHPYYNIYLSKPFAVTYEAYQLDELQQLKSVLDREILWSGAYLRAGLDPLRNAANPVLRDYSGAVVRKSLLPGVTATVRSMAADYIMGPNPPDIMGYAEVPGTFGTVSAHSGEFRMETTDFTLPGRRMPIVFQRSAAGQDLYEGPFGRGWDFNYNQRLVELKGLVFHPDSSLPLVIRGDGKDEIAHGNDILLHTGNGRTVNYRFVGETVPSEYATDPLATELGWIQKAAAFYLPPLGVFEMLVRFTDGKYGRLDPAGTQYWYSPEGRLEKIQDRYENAIVLNYTDAGELKRIVDASVNTDRYLEIGYYRLQDTSPVQFPDEATADGWKVGKICRLLDYVGRDVLFSYDACGDLKERMGIRVVSAHEGGFRERAVSSYVPAADRSRHQTANGIRGVTAGSTNAATLFTAQVNSTAASPVVNQGVGGAMQGPVTVNLQHQNSAAALASGSARTEVATPDSARAEFAFGGRSLPRLLKMTGPRADPALIAYEYSTNGLVTKITYPETNTVEYVYDEQNLNLRSRANLLKVTRSPGPRGDGGSPPIPTAEFSGYDPKYNFPVGNFRDFNGNTITLIPTADGRDVGVVVYPGSGSNVMTYNSHGQLLREKTLEGLVNESVYHPDTGFPMKTVRGDNPRFETMYEYVGIDGKLGLPTRTILPKTDSASIETDYDEREQLITITRAQNKQKELRSYDLNGNLVRRQQQVDEDRVMVTTSHYLPNGFLKSVTMMDVETATGQTTNLTVEYVEDEMYRVKEIRFPGGEVQRFQDYDHLGRRLRMSIGDYGEGYAYDLNGNLQSLWLGTATNSPEFWATNLYRYDGHDRLHSQKIADTNGFEETIRAYHGNGELKSVIVRDAQGQTNWQALYAVDSLGRVTNATVVADDTQPPSTNHLAETTTIYAPLRVTIVNPVGERTTLEFNSAGQTLRRSNSIQEVSFFPDPNNNLTRTLSTEQGRNYLQDFQPFNDLDQSLKRADSLGNIASFDKRLDGVATAATDARNHTVRSEVSKLGETLTLTRPNNVAFRYGYAPHRTIGAVKDAANRGRSYAFDNFRLKGVTFRDGSSLTVEGFDPRNRQPLVVQIPDGSITSTNDPQGRVRGRRIAYQTDVRFEEFTFDALGRIQAARYPSGEIAYAYHPLGPLKTVTNTIQDVTYEIGSRIRHDGGRTALLYPTNPVPLILTETRDLAGRLTSVVPSEGEIIIATNEFAAAELAGRTVFGSNAVVCENVFDSRKRLLGRRYLNGVTSNVLAEVRYAYDATDNIVARQYLHRAARADFFDYDAAHRLTRADLGVRPRLEEEGVRPGYGPLPIPEPFPQPIGTNWVAGYFGREYDYDTNGLDLITQVHEINPNLLSIPPFARSLSDPDGLLHLRQVDGFTRTRDSLGNVTRMQVLARPAGMGSPIPIAASLRYNGNSQLIEMVRDDGVTNHYAYDHNGLCFHRRTESPNLPGGRSDTAFIYHNGLLLAEYEQTGQASLLKARYYYGSGDVPVAADLRDAGGQLQRYYALQDAAGSVMGLADATGNVIERFFYDAWGQFEVEQRDTQPPQIRRIQTAADGLLIEFTERILPPAVPTEPETLVTNLASLAGALTVTASGVPVPGTIRVDESVPGFGFGTVLRFVPSGALGGNCELNLHENRLVDEWNNPNVKENVSFAFNPIVGTDLFVNASTPSTGPVRTRRSSVDWPFLFHGQYFDYESGLVYMRARFYDMSTGLFLQPDPHGYEDSVNLYAAFRHNPVTYRDPSGTQAHILAGAAFGFAFDAAAQYLENGGFQDFNWRRSAAAAGGGAISAFYGGAAGQGFFRQSFAAVVGGITSRHYLGDDKLSPKAMFKDAAIGGGFYGASKIVGAVAKMATRSRNLAPRVGIELDPPKPTRQSAYALPPASAYHVDFLNLHFQAESVKDEIYSFLRSDRRLVAKYKKVPNLLQKTGSLGWTASNTDHYGVAILGGPGTSTLAKYTFAHETAHVLIKMHSRNPYGTYGTTWQSVVWEEAMAFKYGYAWELALGTPKSLYSGELVPYAQGGDEWLLRVIAGAYGNLSGVPNFTEQQALSLLKEIRDVPLFRTAQP